MAKLMVKEGTKPYMFVKLAQPDSKGDGREGCIGCFWYAPIEFRKYLEVKNGQY